MDIYNRVGKLVGDGLTDDDRVAGVVFGLGFASLSILYCCRIVEYSYGVRTVKMKSVDLVG